MNVTRSVPSDHKEHWLSFRRQQTIVYGRCTCGWTALCDPTTKGGYGEAVQLLEKWHEERKRPLDNG